MEFFNYEPITVNKRICINPGAIESLHKTTASLPVQKAQLNSKVNSWSLFPLLSTIWSSFQECLAEKSDLVLPPTPGIPLINITRLTLIQSVN